MSTSGAYHPLPLVSVILCVFNGDKQVALAIEDILSQTYENFELIISDDASTDGTPSVLEKFRGDRRIRIFHQPTNLGFVANKNFAIGQARGEFITQQDHDDRSDRTRLARQVKALANTGLSVVGCGVRRLDQLGREIGRIAAEEDIVIDRMPEGGLPFFFAPTMFSREVWQRDGPFNEYFAESFGEDNYFISCVLRSYSIAVIADCLYDYVDTPSSATSILRSRRGLVMVPILRRLAKQNTAVGTNDLEQGRFDVLAAAEETILEDRVYVAEQYRAYAARAIDHGLFADGARLIGKAWASKPFSLILMRTVIYLLRQMAARAK